MKCEYKGCNKEGKHEVMYRDKVIAMLCYEHAVKVKEVINHALEKQKPQIRYRGNKR